MHIYLPCPITPCISITSLPLYPKIPISLSPQSHTCISIASLYPSTPNHILFTSLYPSIHNHIPCILLYIPLPHIPLPPITYPAFPLHSYISLPPITYPAFPLHPYIPLSPITYPAFPLHPYIPLPSHTLSSSSTRHTQPTPYPSHLSTIPTPLPHASEQLL